MYFVYNYAKMQKTRRISKSVCKCWNFIIYCSINRYYCRKGNKSHINTRKRHISEQFVCVNSHRILNKKKLQKNLDSIFVALKGRSWIECLYKSVSRTLHNKSALEVGLSYVLKSQKLFGIGKVVCRALLETREVLGI